MGLSESTNEYEQMASLPESAVTIDKLAWHCGRFTLKFEYYFIDCTFECTITDGVLRYTASDDVFSLEYEHDFMPKLIVYWPNHNQVLNIVLI